MATVLIDADGLVDPTDRIKPVSKRANENVRWVAKGNGGPWKVTFDKDSSGSPFSATEYVVAHGGSGGSTGGPIAGVVGRTYRYNVRNANTGVVTDDPDVDIES